MRLTYWCNCGVGIEGSDAFNAHRREQPERCGVRTVTRELTYGKELLAARRARLVA